MNSNKAIDCSTLHTEELEDALNAGFPEFSEMPDFCGAIPSDVGAVEVAKWFESSLLSPEVQAMVCDAVKDGRVSQA